MKKKKKNHMIWKKHFTSISFLEYNKEANAWKSNACNGKKKILIFIQNNIDAQSK